MRKQYYLKKTSGLTLIEILIVVCIVAVLWMIMVNLFKGKIFLTKQITCDAILRTIQGQLEIQNSRTGKFPKSQKEFKKFLNDWRYFTKKPECPFGWPYTLNLKTSLVEKHKHKEEKSYF